MADRWRAVGRTTALFVVALVAVWWLADGPIERRPTGEQRVAAVAIRDDVIAFQKFGTELFTVPTLGRAYDDLVYITEAYRGDGRDRFVAAIEEAAKTHDAVDVWILAHGNHFVYWLWNLSPQARAKLRLVYNTGCANAYQARQWHAVGAKTYVGHPGRTSVSPLFYVFFARRFVRGVDRGRRDGGRQPADAAAASDLRVADVGGLRRGAAGQPDAGGRDGRRGGCDPMKRAVTWLGVSYGVHLMGLLAFWWTWEAAFGDGGRTIAQSWDIPLAYGELVGTGVLAAVAVGLSMRARPAGVLLTAGRGSSLFLAVAWLWSVLVLAGIV